MAIVILGKSKCALCGEVQTKTEEIVMTSHFIADPTHPLYRYSDASMHQHCFLKWPSRHAFVRLFNEVHKSRTGQQLYMDGVGTVEEGTELDALRGLCLSLWIILEEVRMKSGYLSLDEMLAVPTFKEAWDELTDPKHIPVFEADLMDSLNPTAREWREAALKEAKRRSQVS